MKKTKNEFIVFYSSLLIEEMKFRDEKEKSIVSLWFSLLFTSFLRCSRLVADRKEQKSAEFDKNTKTREIHFKMATKTILHADVLSSQTNERTNE